MYALRSETGLLLWKHIVGLPRDEERKGERESWAGLKSISEAESGGLRGPMKIDGKEDTGRNHPQPT